MKVKRDRLVINPTFRPRIVAEVRRKNREPLLLSVSMEGRPEVASLIARLSTLDRSFKRLPKELAEQMDFLISAGILIPAAEAPKTVNPECSVSRSLLPFVPGTMRKEAALAVERGELQFNHGNVFIQTRLSRPQSDHPGMVPEESYPRGPSLIWVFDPGTRMWAAYRAPARALEVIGGLQSRASAARRLDPGTSELLWHARVLVAPGHARRREVHWQKELGKAAHHLESEGFAVVRRILPPLQIAACRRYFRHLESEGYLALSTREHRARHGCVRYTRHNDVMLQFLHRQSGRMARRISGSQILPSYSFLSAYLPNSSLKKHTDRPQCAWNASVLIDQQPEVPVEESWPIYLETPAGRVRDVRLDFGDAVFYPGQDVPHWRESIGPHRRQTLGLWHYVPIDFAGSLD